VALSRFLKNIFILKEKRVLQKIFIKIHLDLDKDVRGRIARRILFFGAFGFLRNDKFKLNFINDRQ